MVRMIVDGSKDKVTVKLKAELLQDEGGNQKQFLPFF